MIFSSERQTVRFLHTGDWHLDSPFSRLSPVQSEERRRELTKVVKGFGEEAKVAVRNLRRDANTQLERLEKDKEISEDDQRRYETEIQKLTDRFVADIDKVIAEKDKEIMTV